MSNYAKIVGEIVTQVIVADEDFFKTFIDISPGQWIQTSFNTRGGVHYAPNSNIPDGGVALRGNYAGIGHTYDSKNDVFYAPQPYPSWVISAPSWIWQPPIPYPNDKNTYNWDEQTKSWALISTLGP